MPNPFMGTILFKSHNSPKREEKHSTRAETLACFIHVYLKVEHSARDTVGI